MFAPAGTPQPIVDGLQREFVRIVQQPDIRAAMTKPGLDPVWQDARAVVARAKEARALWTEVIEKTGMKIE